MKRVGNLFEQVCDVENCKQAILTAVRNKKPRQRRRLLQYRDNVDYYAVVLSEMLKNKEYQPSGYGKFVGHDGIARKERIISTTRFFPDHCAYIALLQVTGKILRRGTYRHSYAGIKGRGSLRAAAQVQKWLKQDSKHTKYCLKMDIRQFYPSMNNEILKSLIRRLIKDKDVLDLYDSIIDVEQGVPIGTVLSPYFADVMLQSLDYLIKQELRDLCKYYVRYADDMCVFGNNKRNLHKVLQAVQRHLANLGLEVKDNYQVFLVERIETQGRNKGKRHGRRIDFVGYAMSHVNVRVRKRIAIRIMRTCRKIADGNYSYKLCARFISYCGFLKYSCSESFKRKYIYKKIKIGRVKEVISHETKMRLLEQRAAAY